MSKILKRAAGFLLALGLVTAVYADSIITGSKPFTFIPGTVISSSQVNADFDYIINQVNTNAAKNGANSSITSLLGLTTPIAPGFGGSSTYVATTVGGTANAITITATQPAISSYTLSNRNIVVFKATNQNTGATTLDVNTTGATNLVKQTTNGLIALQNGDILVNNVYHVFYDGTDYILINNPQLFGQQSDFTAAATLDLGLAQSHNVQVATGTTTITSFGSSASSNNPIYIVKFATALIVTHNATSLVLPGLTNYTTTAGDAMLVEYIGSGNWRVRAIWPRNFPAPTVQRFTSGTAATYTPPANLRYIEVTMVGGGAGGGAQNTNNGTAGGASSFGSWTAVAGAGGAQGAGGAGGAGGTGGVNGTGTLIDRHDGSNGGTGNASAPDSGGMGGNSVFAGGGAQLFGVAGQAAKTNSGSGGSGARNAGSGGAGEYVKFYMTIAQIGASQTYTVGTGGNGGAAGTLAGGNGAAGIITVQEFYQ